MLKNINKISEKIYDGGSDKLSNQILDFNINNELFSISLKEIKPLEEINTYCYSITPGKVSNDLSLKITNFDGMEIYHGSKKGLKLYFHYSEDRNLILIFSFGEFQPGRFICQYEGFYKV
ncbi:MAG: hypothetical protein VB958_08000 [Thalassolituus sp.]|uniref:hypothetical protein n=1 Tax=Thalassolituus sp. TaxID=2030822 RepID=UPI00398292C1